MANSKQTKTVARKSSPKAPARKKAAAPPAPTEEEIRKKAEEIYHERMAGGIDGSAEEDWLKAELLLNKKGK